MGSWNWRSSTHLLQPPSCVMIAGTHRKGAAAGINRAIIPGHCHGPRPCSPLSDALSSAPLKPVALTKQHNYSHYGAVFWNNTSWCDSATGNGADERTDERIFQKQTLWLSFTSCSAALTSNLPFTIGSSELRVEQKEPCCLQITQQHQFPEFSRVKVRGWKGNSGEDG